MPIWEFALVIFLLVLSVLLIYLIPAVINLNRAAKKFTKTIDTVNEDLPDILYDISEMTYSASNSIKRVENTINNLGEMEKTFSNEIKRPILEAASTLAGFLQAIQTFISFFVKKK